MKKETWKVLLLTNKVKLRVRNICRFSCALYAIYIRRDEDFCFMIVCVTHALMSSLKLCRRVMNAYLFCFSHSITCTFKHVISSKEQSLVWFDETEPHRFCGWWWEQLSTGNWEQLLNHHSYACLLFDCWFL